MDKMSDSKEQSGNIGSSESGSGSNANNNNNNNNINSCRQSASPARTIDSVDSTIGSMDTIVDRHLNCEEMLQAAIEQSTNTTNDHHHGSLTNSQIAMLQLSDEEQPSLPPQHEQRQEEIQQQQQHQQHPDQQQQQQSKLDAQSHIYSSPVYDQKPPLQLTAATAMLATAAGNGVGSGAGGAYGSNIQHTMQRDDAAQKPKLITHEEFQKQLQEVVASRANTLDSRISKKQRFPPELIKIKDGDASSTRSSRLKRKQRQASAAGRASSACCSAFPLQIVLGTLQLFLAISLVALGSLLIVRDAALSTAGCGIWTGLIAAITGALGVVSMRKTQTAFLALSLVCIATSTLALAISGAGLSRDINRSEQKIKLMSSNNEISAAYGLIFTLFLHFVVSIVSVYRCAMQVCSRSQNAALRDVIINPNISGIAMDQDKMDQYLKAMSSAGNEKENNEKLAAMWMYAAQMGSSLPPPSLRKLTPPSRPIMLIPAGAGSTSLLASPPPQLPPPGMILAPPPMIAQGYRGGIATLPYIRAGSTVVYGHPGSMPGTFRTHKSSKSAGVTQQKRRRRGIAQAGSGQQQQQQQHHQQHHQARSGKLDANRRQRRKSAADVIDGQANFQYTGLDRTIADNFLARQEQSNTGSHVDYASSSSASEAYDQTMPPKTAAASNMKIICRDVVM